MDRKLRKEIHLCKGLLRKAKNLSEKEVWYGHRHFEDYYIDLLGEKRYKTLQEISKNINIT